MDGWPRPSIQVERTLLLFRFAPGMMVVIIILVLFRIYFDPFLAPNITITGVGQIKAFSISNVGGESCE